MDLTEMFNSDCPFQHALEAKRKMRRLPAPCGITFDTPDDSFAAEMPANRASVPNLR